MPAAGQNGAMPPETFGAMVHYPLFGKAFLDKGRALGIPCYALFPTLGVDDGFTAVTFLKSELLK